MTSEKKTGTAVPLGALYSKENPVIGEFPDLKPFADFCAASGLSIIQLLPVNDTGTQSSPYSGLSAFALHPVYIRIKDVPGFDALYASSAKFKKQYDTFIKNNAYSRRYDYDAVLKGKNSLLKELYDNSPAGLEGKASPELTKFIKANPWVKTYAVYKNLKWNYQQASWKSWIKSDQSKTPEQIEALWSTKAFWKEHLFYVWQQLIASGQFADAVQYVHQKGILLKGDMPILMNEDSCDAWAYPQFFNQSLRAGSPADGDNPAGQNWGFPTYNWKNLKAADYSWWKQRLVSASAYYDAYRLDHILGFFRIWAIPAGDSDALCGHSEPCAVIKRDELYELGFDDDRIRWLSRPHIPTGVVEDITWNHEKAHKILENFCTRLDGEELWLFDEAIKDSSAITARNLGEFCDEETAGRIKAALVRRWSDRTLLEIAKNKFVPLWTYTASTSWKTLSEKERALLMERFSALDEKNLKLWEKHADEILGALTACVKMTPCGEDLGVGIECVPKVMEKNGILGLRVVRWCRDWGTAGSPYVPFADYTPLSVCTTSVHDSSTIRQWWEEEKDSVRAFVAENIAFFDEGAANADERAAQIAGEPFSPQKAESVLKASATAASCYFIPPLQDFLYLKGDCWLEKATDERINVPGTVTAFNWTYRLPCSLEELNDSKELIEAVKKISSRA